jgi:hypothetical protein
MSDTRRSRLTSSCSGPSNGIAATPRVLHFIVHARRASGGSARPLNCGVRRMICRHRKLVIIVVCVTILPFLLELLTQLTPDIGLIWFFAHQLYYLPLSEIGEPFFIPDSEVGFWVQWPGRLLAMIVYGAGVVLLVRAYARWRTRGHETRRADNAN